MELHEVVFVPGDHIVIIDDPEVEDGTKGIVKETGVKANFSPRRDTIVVVRMDDGGWTHLDGTRHCWNVWPEEIALDPDAEEFEVDQ